MKMMLIPLYLCLHSCPALADDKPKSTSAKEPALRKELLRRVNVDQEARKAWVTWMNSLGSKDVSATPTLAQEKNAEFERITAKVKKIDGENTKWLKGAIVQYGWPTITMVGKDGANAAWLLVQHADAEPKFQRRCLDLMSKLPKSEVSQSDLAYLTDRVLLAEGKKQVYGTQFTTVNGQLKPRPIEDEANVDKRRAEAGLPTMAEYLKQAEQIYGNKAKK